MMEGAAIVFGAGYDLRQATKLTLGIVRPDGSLLYVKTPLVKVGLVNLPTVASFLPAFTYALYIVQAGDLPTLGIYTVQLYDEPFVHPKRLSNTFTL